MTRPTRLDIAGGWYQVVNRGIERRSIFRASSGYEHFIGLISALPKRFGLRVHGYVLMPNHYHLQIETPKANLSRAIQWLNVSYSIWFNKKYRPIDEIDACPSKSRAFVSGPIQGHPARLLQPRPDH